MLFSFIRHIVYQMYRIKKVGIMIGLYTQIEFILAV